MSRLVTAALMRVGTRFLPFADAASRELPLPRLLRLGLFQVSVGMAMTLLAGTLNRVMIVELGVAAGLVAAMLALPMLFAPLRALVGYRSDVHRSALGWRRVPYLWMGSMLQFGGLAIMPFALILLNGDKDGSLVPGTVGAALAFLLVGAGAHTVQTAGLALATDLAPERDRPRVVALLWVMLLLGMAGSALLFGLLLRDFSNTRLVQVVQGAAVLTMALNLCALWKQEARDPDRAARQERTPGFAETWSLFVRVGRTRRLLLAVGLGTAGFAMQDILLEPYGGEILGLAVGATTVLTALLAAGALTAFGVAARVLGRGGDPVRLAGMGAVAGVFAFAAVIFASPLGSGALFRAGVVTIGFGSGLFAVGTLTAAMALERGERNGLAVGAWGAVQATAAGIAITMGGVLRDVVGGLAQSGALGVALSSPATGYSVVYHVEIVLLFATLVTIGPLVAPARAPAARPRRFGLAEFPQ